MNHIKTVIDASIGVKQRILEDESLLEVIGGVAERMIEVLRGDHKIWLCGNGGSASDAQHIAAELSGRFYYDRPALFVEALHVNTSYLTAVANDYGFNRVYARLIEGKGRSGDMLISLSTSGNSRNVLEAMWEAQKRGIVNVALTGETGGELEERKLADYLVNVPSRITPRIQEAHIMIGHIWCELVEAALFPRH